MEAPTGQKDDGTGRSTKVITDKNKRSRGDSDMYPEFWTHKKLN